jgi:hypothetical protein
VLFRNLGDIGLPECTYNGYKHSELGRTQLLKKTFNIN